MNSLKLLLSQNQRDRIAKESAAQNRISDPSLPRHTTYQGDRKIQQLGGEIIENGIVLNNQSLTIGDVVMPLAKGNVLRRVDNTNGGALLGTAYRDAIENDYDANGNRRNSVLSRNGGNEPSDPINPNPINPSTHPISPPPYGCTPPPPKCFWTTNPEPPVGFQNHGSAVVNENAVPLYLHCTVGSTVPRNLNCSFLDKWKCSGGVCSPDANGTYNSQAECEAALIPPTFTGGQCAVLYRANYISEMRISSTGALIISQSYSNLIGGTPMGPILTGPVRTVSGGYLSFPVIASNGTFYCNLIGSSHRPSPDYFDYFIINFSFSRIDGLPDNCGNLPSTCPLTSKA